MNYIYDAERQTFIASFTYLLIFNINIYDEGRFIDIPIPSKFVELLKVKFASRGVMLVALYYFKAENRCMWSIIREVSKQQYDRRDW